MSDAITWERKIKRPVLSELSRKVLGCDSDFDVKAVRFEYDWWAGRNALVANLFDKTDWAFEYMADAAQSGMHIGTDGFCHNLFLIVHKTRDVILDREELHILYETYKEYGLESDEFQALLSKQYSQMEYLDAEYGMRKRPPPPSHESWGSFA